LWLIGDGGFSLAGQNVHADEAGQEDGSDSALRLSRHLDLLSDAAAH
jgi:hypothetical protein